MSFVFATHSSDQTMCFLTSTTPATPSDRKDRGLKARSSDLNLEPMELEEANNDDDDDGIVADYEDRQRQRLGSRCCWTAKKLWVVRRVFTTETWHLFLLFFSAGMYAVMGCFVKLCTSRGGLSPTEIVVFRGVFQFSIVLVSMCWFTRGVEDSEHGGGYKPVASSEDFQQCEEEEASSIVKQATVPRPTTTTLIVRPKSRPLICYNPFGAPNVYKIVIVRGMVGGAGFCFYYQTISYLPLGDAVTMLSLNPVVTVLLAAIVLKEPITKSKALAATCSVLGALLMARPSFVFGPASSHGEDGEDELALPVSRNDDEAASKRINPLGYVTGLMGACCGAAVYILIRKAGKQGVHTLNMLFSWCVFGLLISGGITLLTPQQAFVWPSSREVWGYVSGACLSGVVAHFLLNYSARITPAGIASIIRSSGIVWSYIFEVLVFHQVPGILTLLGVGLILTSLVFIAIEKRQASANEQQSLQQGDASEQTDE